MVDLGCWIASGFDSTSDDYYSCVGMMRPQKTGIGLAGCGGSSITSGNPDAADVASDTPFDLSWLDTGYRPEVEEVDVPKDQADASDGGDLPPADVPVDVPPADVPVVPDAVADGADAMAVDTDGDGIMDATSTDLILGDGGVTDTEEEGEVGEDPDASTPDTPDAILGDVCMPPDGMEVCEEQDGGLDGVGTDGEGDTAVGSDGTVDSSTDTGPTVPGDYVPPAVNLPDYLQGDTGFWLEALYETWANSYASYLTAFQDSDGNEGLVVTDPVSGYSTSEGVAYGMKGSAGTALMLSTLGTLEGGDFLNAVKLQNPFDKLLRGYKKMMQLGDGLGAWNVVVDGGILKINPDIPGAENSASDADIDVYMALRIAQRLVDIKIWQQGEFDYGAEAAAILDLIRTREVFSFGGKLVFAPSEDWGCDVPLVNGECPAMAINPAYGRAFAFQLAAESDENMFFLGMDQIDLLDEILQITGNEIPDWISFGADGVIDASHTYPGFGMFADGVRGPMAFRGGASENTSAMVLGMQMLAGRNPLELAADWLVLGIPSTWASSMGYLSAVSTQDPATVAEYVQALQEAYLAQGGFGSGPEDYYAHSLGMMAGVDAYSMYLFGY